METISARSLRGKAVLGKRLHYRENGIFPARFFRLTHPAVGRPLPPTALTPQNRPQRPIQ